MNTSPQPFFEFEWPVAPDYKWVEWLDKDLKPVRPTGYDAYPKTAAAFSEKKGEETGPVLMPIEGPSSVIHPMDRDHATLFRRFADLDGKKTDAILSFARQNGWLGVTPRPSQLFGLPDGLIHHAEGEPHQLWVNEIAKMRRAIWLWEHQEHLDGEEEKFLTWLFDSHLQHVQGRMTFATGRPAQLRIAPMTLLSALWLQLAMAVAGNKSFVKCKFCERQIEISTAETGFRSNRAFCSQSCKTKDYRLRKREAIRHARRGKTVAAIAKLTATEPGTVRVWVKALQSRKRTADSK